jgi:hypothetical protein
MNSNRIEINGVWYVREDAIQDPIDFLGADEMSVTNSLRCTYEVIDWCFEASILLQDDAIDLSDTNGDPWIKVTDKRPDMLEWKEQDVDSAIWMLGVLEGDRDSMRLAYEIFNNDGIYHFRAFLRVLIQKGWLIKQ